MVTQALFADYVDYAAIESMLQEADTDKNGTIELNEWVDVLKKHRSSNE